MKKYIVFVMFLITGICYAAQTQTNANTPALQNPKNQVYQVDIVVFKNLKSINSVDPSQWKLYTQPNLAFNYDLLHESEIQSIANDQQQFFIPLASNTDTLNPEMHHLKNSSIYQIFTQQSWLQKISDPGQTVLITTGQNFSNNVLSPIWEVYGTVRLSKSLYHYIYLNVEFILTEPNSLEVTSNQNPNANPNFHSLILKETRRIKVGQLNYLDSPGLGLLIKVTKIPNNTGASTT